LVGTPEPPGGDPDREQFSKDAGVPVEGVSSSDFIIEGRWGEVDEVLRGVYEGASKALGQDFPYPGDEKSEKK
jgi:ribonuclease Z